MARFEYAPTSSAQGTALLAIMIAVSSGITRQETSLRVMTLPATLLAQTVAGIGNMAILFQSAFPSSLIRMSTSGKSDWIGTTNGSYKMINVRLAKDDQLALIPTIPAA